MYSVYLDIIPSKNKNKKYDAIFYINDMKVKTISFGAKGYIDYTIGATDNQRMNYINRHRHNENWNTPLNAGSLSRFILWETDDINKNIKRFKKKFNLG
jgi:hypothetical protein